MAKLKLTQKIVDSLKGRVGQITYLVQNEGHINMEMTERNKIICELRESGSKFAEIAKLFNISSGRAGQIYIKEKRKMDHADDMPVLVRMLSTRVKSALLRWFKDKHILDNPQNIIDGIKSSDLKNVPYLGKKPRQELISTLSCS